MRNHAALCRLPDGRPFMPDVLSVYLRRVNLARLSPSERHERLALQARADLLAAHTKRDAFPVIYTTE